MRWYWKLAEKLARQKHWSSFKTPRAAHGLKRSNSFKLLYNSAGGHGGAAASSVWSELQDEQGRSYYYNTQTGVSQWEKPSE